MIRTLPSLLKRLAYYGYLDDTTLGDVDSLSGDALTTVLHGIADNLMARRQTPSWAADAHYQTPSDAFQACITRFDEVDLSAEERGILAQLRPWGQEAYARLAPTFQRRRESGFTVPALGIIEGDVCGDLAVMAAESLSHDQLRTANVIADRYLEVTGDYATLRVLIYFIAYVCLYRALEEVKDPDTRLAYLREAGWVAEFRVPYLLIGAGVHGSGKSDFTYSAMKELGGIRIRASVERARILGKSVANAPEDFDDATTDQTYRHIAHMTGLMLEAGYPVYIDGSCLTRAQRALLRNEAEARGLAVMIVSFEADQATLEARVTERQRRLGLPVDAGLRILSEQQTRFEPFDDEELFHLVHLDTTQPDANDTLVALIRENVRIPGTTIPIPPFS